MFGGMPASSLEGVNMKLVKRFAIALSSLLALAIAGGAHWKW